MHVKILSLVLDFYRYHYDFNAYMLATKAAFSLAYRLSILGQLLRNRYHFYTGSWDKINIAIDFGYTNTWLYFWKIFGPNFPRRFLIFTGQGLWIANLRCCVYKKRMKELCQRQLPGKSRPMVVIFHFPLQNIDNRYELTLVSLIHACTNFFI